MTEEKKDSKKKAEEMLLPMGSHLTPLTDGVVTTPKKSMTKGYYQPPAAEGDTHYGSDWKKIIDDFKEKYPDSPVDENDPVLNFDSREDAIAFFTDQATRNPPREFFVTEVDENRQPTGYHCFSCGDGKLYDGSLNDIRAALQQSLKDNPDDPKTSEGLNFIESKILNKSAENRSNAQNDESEPDIKDASDEADLSESDTPSLK